MSSFRIIKWLRLDIIVIVIGIYLQPIMAQQIAIKTNIITDLGLVPNVGVELVVGEKNSLNVELTGTVSKPWGKDIGLTIGGMQYRYWVAQRSMVQLFIGAGVKVGSYTYNNPRGLFEADMAMAELTAGYAWPLSKRWNLEFSYGIGILARHRHEVPLRIDSPVQTGMKYDIATTSIGLNIVYILK